MLEATADESIIGVAPFMTPRNAKRAVLPWFTANHAGFEPAAFTSHLMTNPSTLHLVAFVLRSYEAVTPNSRPLGSVHCPELLGIFRLSGRPYRQSPARFGALS